MNEEIVIYDKKMREEQQYSCFTHNLINFNNACVIKKESNTFFEYKVGNSASDKLVLSVDFP